MKIALQIIAIIVVIVGIIYTNPTLFPALYERLEALVEPSDSVSDRTTDEQTAPPAAEQQRSLTTTVTPARDLAGRWSGVSPQGATYRQAAICEYGADLSLTLQQNGEAITGTLRFTTRSARDLDANDFTPCPPTGYLAGDIAVRGTVGGASVAFETVRLPGDPALPLRFTGTFTSDIMSGTFGRQPYASSALGEMTRVDGTWIVSRSR